MPNIEGSILGGPCASSLFQSNYASGAFSLTGWGYGKTEGVGWNNSSSLIANFSASRVNSAYGKRNEVAPGNFTIRIWKRTA